MIPNSDATYNTGTVPESNIFVCNQTLFIPIKLYCEDPNQVWENVHKIMFIQDTFNISVLWNSAAIKNMSLNISLCVKLYRFNKQDDAGYITNRIILTTLKLLKGTKGKSVWKEVKVG